jgi:hypothetical protein
MLKNFQDFLNENYKPLGLGEPKELSPGIFYDGDWEYFAKETGLSVEELVESHVEQLGLVSGELFQEKQEFAISGVTKNGNVIFIEQYGEYDMYGGPYSPKMEKPTIKINGVDLDIKAIEEEFKKEGIDWNRFPDMTLTYAYGYIMNKSKVWFTSKKFGL